jgi:cation:H+ antiporter
LKNIVFLVFSLAIILLGAEFFTNGIEWLGKKLKLGEGAVGSILAAVGTALPETMIPVIAILFHRGTGGVEVGIGAILGAPFMLGTLAFFMVGSAAFIFRRSNKALFIDSGIIIRDLQFFILVYSLAILATFFPPSSLKIGVAVILVGAYFIYVYRTIRSSRSNPLGGGSLPSFYFAKGNQNPPFFRICFQVLSALFIMVVGVQIFVDAVQEVALAAGIPVLILSLIITPIATELPEKFNSVLWIRRGKDTLAMGNITGAMVFQSSLIPALGIALTPWVLEPLALASGLLVLISALGQYFVLSKKKSLFPAGLLMGGVFYALFIALVLRGGSF